jgi:hypothetical protein
MIPCYNGIAQPGTNRRICNMGDKSPKKAEKKKKKKEVVKPTS